jgi:hypothetical protein
VPSPLDKRWHKDAIFLKRGRSNAGKHSNFLGGRKLRPRKNCLPNNRKKST